jgi:hypothetical protein
MVVMDIEKPALANASPGQPVTAQAWNALVSAILELYDALAAIDDGTTLRVSVTHDGRLVRDAEMVASNGDLSVQAVAPLGGTEQYILGGLTEGKWTLRIQAPGLKEFEEEIEMAQEEPLKVAMESDGSVAMPDLFGLVAKEALAELGSQGISIESVFDTSGQELTRSSLTRANSDSRILYQFPATSTLINPKNERARLVVGVKLVQREFVAVPDLQGLTLEEAEKVLKENGLDLGEVGFLQASDELVVP